MLDNMDKDKYFQDNLCSCEQCELKSAFFEHVAAQDINILCIEKIDLIVPKGDVVIKQGEKISDFIYLKSGLIKLSRISKDGAEQIINIAKPFDFVSLMSVFSDEHYKYSITAIEDSELCQLDLKKVKNLISRNGEFALDILTKMSRSNDRITNMNLDIRKKNLIGRVAYVLLYFSNEIYNSDEFELPISRKEFADYIGKTTENVVRNLSELKKSKIIKIFGKTIEIIDKKRLNAIANFG